MASFTEADREFMREAVALATNGEGRVSPNPPVGCVLVRNSQIIGRGWHNRLGDLHAETAALKNAGGDAAGATVYVTLSPCTTHGRQPPCADALIKVGVARVVIAATDPNPRNADGATVLAEAGIPVQTGLLREEAEYVARGFFKMIRKGTPFLTLKYAMTLDGRIATATGDSRWISSPSSRELVHDMRSRHDAVLAGIGTALADNPLLTVREPAWSARGGREGHVQPVRVIVDSHCRLPADAALFDPAHAGGKVFLACLRGGDDGRAARLEQAGAEILWFDSSPERPNRVPLHALVHELGRRGISMIFCEGGAGLAGGLVEEDVVDEVAAFIAPKLIGGAEAPGPVGGRGVERMADAMRFEATEWKIINGDILFRGTVSRPCNTADTLTRHS